MKRVFTTSREKENEIRKIEEEIERKRSEISSNDFSLKTRKDKFIMYGLLSLSCVLMIIYFVSTVLNSFNSINQVEMIISVLIISIFTILFIISSLFLDQERKRNFSIVSSIILSIYFLFMILTQNNILKLPNQSTVLNFYNKDITEVVKWAEKHSILVEQVYENSDYFEIYKVISQDVEPGTLTKDIEKITVIVSDGPSSDKEELIPDMINWDVDQVVEFAQEHFLTNLTIKFEFNDKVEKDLVYEQNNESDVMFRDSKIELKVSLGKKSDLESIAMVNLVGTTSFKATTWLGRNAINYSIEYGYSDKYDEGTVIKQSVSKGKIIDKERTKEVIITVARKNEITIPDFSKMSASEITSWATDNKLKVNFEEEYDDTISAGKVIRSSKVKGDIVEVGDTINIVLSKGQIKMIKFTNVDSFKEWADENEITYHIDYQFSNSVKTGELISSSHKENQVIKNTDTVSLVISQGGTTTIPNFIGKTKTEAEDLCDDNNLECEFIYSSSSEDKDIVINQSMKKGSNVPSGTSITITLSK